MNKVKRMIIVLLMAVLVTAVLPTSARAARVDADRTGRLTISYTDGDKAIVGAEFDIYRVADILSDGEFDATTAFAPVSGGIEGSGSWYDLALTLEGYVHLKDIAPTASGSTHTTGTLSFGGLELGMYLVLGSVHVQDGITYSATPFIVSVPTEDDGDGWLYEIIVSPKFKLYASGGSTVSRSVMKVWDDEDYEDERPEKILVYLFCDGGLYDTVELGKENNWRYTWNGLDPDHRWVVTEKVLSDYTVSVTQEGTMFIITNDYNEPPPPAPPQIPNTGQLWWPVPLLAGGGMLLVLMGLLRRRGAANED